MKTAWAAVLWIASGSLGACRDMRPDPNYCASCPLESVPGEDEPASEADAPSSTVGSRSQGTTATAPASSGQSATTGGSRSTEAGTPSAPEQGGTGGVQPDITSNAGRRAAASASGSGGRAMPATAGSQAGRTGSSSGGAGRTGPRAGEGGTLDAGTTEPMSPCGITCSGATPVCDESRRRCVQCNASETDACGADTPVCNVDICVQCTRDSDCGPERPLCDTNENRCVTCLGAERGSCTGATPACDDQTQECVECSQGQTEACTGTRPQCEADLHRCVECLRNEDCSSPARPRCADYACAGCRSNADCRDSQATVCDLSGECVQCVQQSDCTSQEDCDASRHVCVPKPPPGTKATCTNCDQDSECAVSGSVCAQLAGFGRYCVEVAPPNGECLRPLRAQDVPGKPGQYCLPPDKASCEALALVGTTCPTAGCGPGGLCSQVCTIECNGDLECPMRFKCTADKCVAE